MSLRVALVCATIEFLFAIADTLLSKWCGRVSRSLPLSVSVELLNLAFLILVI